MTPPESAPACSSSEKLNLFISYARADRQIADKLVAALESHDIEVRIDRRDLPYGEAWQPELTEFIRTADTVVWLVSPASISSRWCDWELGEVVRLSKRLVPVSITPVHADMLPAHLGDIHLLPAEGAFTIDKDLNSLLVALSIDRPWLKAHTRLGERARAWAEAGRPENDLLLRGLELEDAEAWIDTAPSPVRGVAPPAQPTELHRAFVAASRAAEEASQRERAMREQAARIAIGYQFSSRAQLALEGGCFDRALRLALAGIRLSEPDAPESLFEDVVDAARASRLKLEVRPKAGIGAAAVTPDQRLAAVLDTTGDLTVWDIVSARVVAALTGRGRPTGGVLGIAIDAGGERILIGRSGDYADVVDARSGKLLQTLGPHKGRTVRVGLVDGTPLSYSTDEPTETVLGARQYFALHMWNIHTGERLYTIDDFASAIDTVLVHPGRSVFVTNHWSGECLAWEIGSGKRIRALNEQAVKAVMCFSPDGRRYLAPGDDFLRISIREWGSNRALSQLSGHTQTIRCACWSPDGTRVATGDGYGIVGLWDAESGERVDWLLDRSGATAPDEITALAFTRDSEGLIVATGAAATMAVWNLKERRVATLIHGHQSQIGDIQVSADGCSLCSVAREEALRVWSLEDFPHSSLRRISMPHPSRAGLRSKRFEAPKLEGIDFSVLDNALGIRIFGPLEGRAALAAVLAHGLGDAEAFTDAERDTDPQVRAAPANPFQALRELAPSSESHSLAPPTGQTNDS